MFNITKYLLFLIMMQMSVVAYAIETPDKTDDLQLKITSPVLISPGKKTTVTFRLINPATQKVVTLRDLDSVHTQKLHLLIIDPSLSDYHHIHPIQTNKPGEFTFSFIPKTESSYRIWADVTPVATHQQYYVMADIGRQSKKKVLINEKVNMVSNVNGYVFTLKFDHAPVMDQALMGSITVTKEGKPVTQLEPIMGAYAHVVGFTDDYQSVVHIHPMGKEPARDTERGGPTLTFHLEPEKAGYIKLFAQVRIDGQDLYAPFGVRIGRG